MRWRPGARQVGHRLGTIGGIGGDQVGEGSFYEVDTDELRARGNGMLGAGDAVHATAARGVLLGHGVYGGAQLGPAGGRFADRYTYLLGQVGDEAVKEGHSMRGSAFAYEESDAMIAASLDSTGPETP